MNRSTSLTFIVLVVFFVFITRPDLALRQAQEIRSFEAVLNDMISEERLTALLSLAFGTLACLIAAIGLYGVVAFGDSRRTNEFGIRMALGARRGDIRTLVLRQMLSVIVCGVAIGIGGALVVVGLLSSVINGMLYGIKPTGRFAIYGSNHLPGCHRAARCVSRGAADVTS